MSKGLEKIVASLELCKLIPAGEFEDTALIHVLSPHGPCVMERPYGTQCEYYPAPTLAEIWRELRNLSVNVIDGSITVSCRIDPEETLYEAAGDDNDVTAAALRLWLKLK